MPFKQEAIKASEEMRTEEQFNQLSTATTPIEQQRDILLELVERMLSEGHFFLTVISERVAYGADFLQWERDAKAIAAKVRGQS